MSVQLLLPFPGLEPDPLIEGLVLRLGLRRKAVEIALDVEWGRFHNSDCALDLSADWCDCGCWS